MSLREHTNSKTQVLNYFYSGSSKSNLNCKNNEILSLLDDNTFTTNFILNFIAIFVILCENGAWYVMAASSRISVRPRTLIQLDKQPLDAK